MSDTGSTLSRRQLGRYLREWRQRSNMTMAQAAELMQWSESTLQRLETGNSERVRWRDIKDLCELYNVPSDDARAYIGLAQQAHDKSWYHEFGDLIPENFGLYMGLEASAQSLTSYQPDIIEGLLQTADYAQVLARDDNPDDTDAELAGRVQIKKHRQSLITRRRTPITLDVVLHEAALRRVVGGPAIMAGQLHHLAEIGKLPNIAIRILPNSAGVPLGRPVGPFVILRFGENKRGEPKEPTVVYVENFLGDLYLEKKTAVDRYDQFYRTVQATALDETASRNFLRQVAKEYHSGR